MITYQEAQNIIASQAKSFGIEVIDLTEADGRVLAEDMFADRDYPPFNRSAMDGYAIRHEDWIKGTRLFEIQEVIYAGNIPEGELNQASAFKIMTGAAVPYPANTVIRREDSVESGNKVSFNIDSLKEFKNIARKGEDLKKAELAIAANSLCTPAVIGTLATIGKSKVPVEALPKVALFTTGNEVKNLNEEVSDVEIRNSNFYMLKSLLKGWQIKPLIYKHLADSKTELKDSIEKALHLDILILSGGVSAGDADFVPEVLESLGVKKLFHKVAIKPGKPFWCGKMPEGPIVFALPGNPFSSFVTFKLFIETFLRKSAGLPSQIPLKSFFHGKKDKKTNLDEFFPVKFCNSGTKVEATKLNGSGDIRLGLDADALGIHPSDIDLLIEGQEIQYFKL
ncbi:molybdopterin molybdotransferase MoeA [Pedobacter sp. P351]|uniref:molybdopterin molybdotransferase MoeA n=1 Tax=Pedobacter superstes TaxID=3133441 RepID=UPI00309A67A8